MIFRPEKIPRRQGTRKPTAKISFVLRGAQALTRARIDKKCHSQAEQPKGSRFGHDRYFIQIEAESSGRGAWAGEELHVLDVGKDDAKSGRWLPVGLERGRRVYYRQRNREPLVGRNRETDTAGCSAASRIQTGEDIEGLFRVVPDESGKEGHSSGQPIADKRIATCITGCVSTKKSGSKAGGSHGGFRRNVRTAVSAAGGIPRRRLAGSGQPTGCISGKLLGKRNDESLGGTDPSEQGS